MKKIHKDFTYIIIAVVSGVAMLFVGIVVSDFFFNNNSSKDHVRKTENEIIYLQQQKEQLLSDNAVLIDQNEEYQKIIDNLSDDFLARLSDDSLQTEVQRMRLLAGLADVEGPGITVSLHDSSIDFVEGEADIIHSQDIQHIIALLIDAGATAIEVNGQRVVNTTSITCVGPTVRINQQRYPAPFVIVAVCDPVIAYDILSNDSRIQNRQNNNVSIEFLMSDHLVIKAYNNPNDIFSIGKELEEISK